jgi:hypothetical protein
LTEIACVVEADDALGECCLWGPATRRARYLDILKPRPQSVRPGKRPAPGHPLPGKNCGCAALPEAAFGG